MHKRGVACIENLAGAQVSDVQKCQSGCIGTVKNSYKSALITPNGNAFWVKRQKRSFELRAERLSSPFAVARDCILLFYKV